MKILLVQPPNHDSALAFSFATEPLALETLAASVPDHDVDLLDLRFSRKTLAAVLAERRPDVVATGGNTCNLYDMVDILRVAKALDPAVRTVVGGHHATLQPADFGLPMVDAIVIGPGEETFPELVSAWERGRDIADIAGLALMRDGRVVKTAERPLPRDLDGSPLPRRDLVAAHRHRYRAFGRAVGLVNTSRGCPYRCSFCSITNEMGGRYLTKRPERVLEDLANVPQRAVRFADGNTFGSPKRAERLADALEGARLGKIFMADARSDTIVRHPALFERWRRAGLRMVAVGMEAVTDRALTAFDKGSSVQDNVEATRVLRGAGLQVIGQFIVDPDFDERDFDELRDFVIDHDIHYPNFTIATPFPGTELWRARADRVVTRDWRRYDIWHSVTFPRLGWERFYRRFIDLYESCYHPRRALGSVGDLLDPTRRRGAASPLVLGAVALQVRLSRRKLEQAYGIRPGYDPVGGHAS
ncbi:MAG: radical SAM protein [Deltaproteobacteria bacterium]|nr:MAG: radical SAM protein [Deltaproteobacteria bacterium]